jgi:alpha-L-rhamnosidase
MYITTAKGLRVLALGLALAAGALSARAAESAGCDWTGISWIGDGRPQPTNDAAFYADDPAPQFRRGFRIEGAVRAARLRIVGLGLYEARVNGCDVTEGGLAPLWTTFSKRVFYDDYDVTKQLAPGENVLAVTLGNGWYNPLPLRMWGNYNLQRNLACGRPCLRLRLEIERADGAVQTIVSDASWKVAGGACLRNNLYLGEVYDARRETPGWTGTGFDDSSWQPAARVAGPGGLLEPRAAPPVAVRERWPAAGISEPRPGVYVADLGRNFAGVARFRLGAGAAGERITLRYGELLNGDGTVNVMTAVCGQIKRPGKGGPGAPDLAEPADVYVRRGGGEESYTPRFTWHGFRYVQLEGLARRPAPSDVEGVALASALRDDGEFECSSPLFNDMHRLCRNTFLSNVFGVQSDCPARERFAYGADIAVSAQAFLLNFDMRAFYAKTAQDFADANEDGWYTMTAPYVGIGDRGFGGRAAPIGWSVGVPVLLQELHRYYGDRECVARHYDACVRYVLLVKEKCPDLIVPRCLSDHEALEMASETITATAHFHHWARAVSEFAAILGRAEDARRHGELADAIRNAFQARFVRGGRVGAGLQGEQAFGLYHRLIPEPDRAAALEILRRDLAAHGGGLTTGIYGTRYLLEVLSEEGLADELGALAARREFPGWGYMLEQGATTLWETWKPSDNVYSRNHPMFGSVDEWLVKHVLGIAPAGDAVGFDKAVIRPQAVGGVTWARGLYRSAKGDLRVSWRLVGGEMKLQIEVPAGMTARVWRPAGKQWAEVGAGRHEW